MSAATACAAIENQAAKWYEAAADHGDTPAQSHLAGLYERGDGVDQDFKEAYFWYAVALRDPKDPTAKQDAEGPEARRAPSSAPPTSRMPHRSRRIGSLKR